MTSVASYPPITVSGTVTSWLPITAAWPVQPACSTLIWEGYPTWQVINDPGYGIYVNNDLSCLPPVATVWWEQDHTAYGTTTLSLGPVVCPDAYTTALTSIRDSSTFVACCPSEYEFLQIEGAGHLNQCQSTLTSGQQISLVIFETITNSNELASAWVTSMSTATGGTVINAIQVNGWNFVPTTSTSAILTTSTSSMSLPPTSPASSTPSPTLTPASLATHSNSTRNIGIGVGVALGAIGILCICFAFWYVRRRRSASYPNARPQPDMQMPPENGGQPTRWGPQPGIGSSKVPTYGRRPGNWAPVQEIGSSRISTVAEMYTPHARPAELEGMR